MVAIEQVISQLQGSNLLLFIVLILLFVVAYKLLQAVIQTAMIALFSGIFLVALSYMGLGPDITPNRIILFMVLGTGLFLFYSMIDVVWSGLSYLYSGLERIYDWAIKPLFQRNNGKRKTTPGQRGGSKEKSIVLQETDD